ncbi:hypothetical protein VB796_16785 [Arcicella sp. LKC2W]|uniref:hypothetical protein n=1 Tax=Arcicella sp. LKC2W TaxID=2984198 RepID=UPI002B1EA0FF|nr:hypothetical protein [Arcicella sp. LKC2W]MEA5460716.1 hypothetical protein [Arcicella sp. LKC2W]
MKKTINFIFSKLTAVTLLVTLVSVTILSSCIEDETGIPKFSTGTPSITKVYLLDTIARYKDSSIVGAEPYKLLVINGQNIGGVVNAYFNGYNTAFNPTYNTDTHLIITLPGEVPTDSTADNKLRLVTSHGEATFSFKVIAKPAVYSTDKITFGSDRGDITLKGKNFSDVSSVIFSKTTTAVKIVSKTKDKAGNETMVLRFPTTNISQTTLDITNSSGVITTRDLEFVNADVALQIFTEDFAKDFGNNSWGDPLMVNADQAYAGKKSLVKTFAAGNWHMAAFSNWWPSVEYSADYKFLTFAIKGGENPISFWIQSDASKVGFGNYLDKNKIDVAPKIWNYYKIPLADLDFWYPGTTLKQFGWRLQGPDKTETLYFDDVMFIKK